MKKYATNNGVWDSAKVLTSALLYPLQPALCAAAWPMRGWPTLRDYQNLLEVHQVKNRQGLALQAVPACTSFDPLPLGYETSVYSHARLSTRLENWHDCFNLLAWCTFPLSKAALNAAHWRVQAGLGMSQTVPATPGPERTPAQDALTQFDESGVVLACADPDLPELLEAFRWKQVFWERRAAVQASLRCFVFGHGLMEKALTPYLGLTGKAVILRVEGDFIQAALNEQLAAVDRQLAAIIDGSSWSSPRALLPFPILGMPGYSPDNESAAYYDNTQYFRPGRRCLVS